MFSSARTFRAQTAALLLTFSLAVPAIGRANGSEPITATRAAAPASVDIKNFGCINPSYYRGGEPKADDFADLAALGVRTLIDLRNGGDSEKEKALAEKAGLTYVRIPMSTRETPSAAQVEQFLGIVNDPARQPIYVHCVEGRHRTGVMTAVYRMVHDGWTADEAFKEMKDYHFGPSFLHATLKKFVYAFHAARSAAAGTK